MKKKLYSEDCRGDKNREEIAKKYYVNPQLAFYILPGQEYINCCDHQKKEYEKGSEKIIYMFEIVNKEDYKKFQEAVKLKKDKLPEIDKQFLFMGEYCAKKLIDITNKINKTSLDLPTPINVLSSLTSSSKSKSKSTSSSSKSSISYNEKINELFLKAIVIVVFIAWKGKKFKNSKLAKIAKETQLKKSILNDCNIKFFFEKILPKDIKSRDLITIYNDVKIAYKNIQSINFQDLIDYYRKTAKYSKC